MGRLLELVSALRPIPAVLTPRSSETRVRQDASCQSLQPTNCQRAPLKPTNSRARASRLKNRLFRPWPSPNTLVLGSDTTSSEGAPDSPRASPIPSDAAIGAATPAVICHRSHPSLSGRGHPCFSWGVSIRALGCSPAARTERCDHQRSLSRYTTRSRFHDTECCRAEDPFRSRPPRQLHSGSGALSTDRSLPPRPCWR